MGKNKLLVVKRFNRNNLVTFILSFECSILLHHSWRYQMSIRLVHTLCLVLQLCIHNLRIWNCQSWRRCRLSVDNRALEDCSKLALEMADVRRGSKVDQELRPDSLRRQLFGNLYHRTPSCHCQSLALPCRKT